MQHIYTVQRGGGGLDQTAGQQTQYWKEKRERIESQNTHTLKPRTGPLPGSHCRRQGGVVGWAGSQGGWVPGKTSCRDFLFRRLFSVFLGQAENTWPHFGRCVKQLIYCNFSWKNNTQRPGGSLHGRSCSEPIRMWKDTFEYWHEYLLNLAFLWTYG